MDELLHINGFIDNKDSLENQEQLFFHLNLSVISGEYLKKYSNFKDVIEKFNNVETIYKIINPDKQVNNIEQDDEKLSDIEFFKSAIKYYKQLADNINDNIRVYLSKKTDVKNNTKPERLKVKYEIEKLFFEKNNFNDSKIKPGYFLFLINLSLAELDEYLECSDKCLEEISIFKKYFQDSSINSISDKWQTPIIKILKDKCDYLEFKINFRKDKNISLEGFDGSAYKLFYDETRSHYSSENISNGCSKFINDCCLEIKEFGGIDINSKKLHQINKFLKRNEVNKIESKISNTTDLISQIDLNIIKNDFDKVSFDSVSNLLQNTKLYFVLEQENKLDFKNILGKDFYKKNVLFDKNKIIEQINNELDRDYIDYRGYEYVIDFLNNLFVKLQNFELSTFDNFENLDVDTLKIYFVNIKENLNRLFDFYETILEKLDDNKKHLNSFELKPIYLELKDCIKVFVIKSPFKDEDEEIDIFLDSSYILPIDFEKIDSKIKENKLTFKIKQQLIEGRLNVLFDLESAKLKLNEVESKFKENDFKIVQIVAMFVSIATFVLINVKIFDNKSGFESIAIVFGLGGVFTLFNGFFNWLILGQIKNDHRNKKDYFSVRIFVTSGILVLISLLILTFHNGDSIMKKMDNNLNVKIDSLVELKSNSIKEKYKNDSLNNLIEKINLDNRLKLIENKQDK